MAADVRPELHLVDPETGEIHETCPGCIKRDGELSALKTEKRGWIARYQNLKREVDNSYVDHDLFPQAKRLFDFWREACKHPRAQFTADRFEQCLPHVRDLGEELCRRAVEGIAYDPFVTQRKNGTAARHDSWSLLFRNREKVEEFANRAPYHLPKPEHVKTLAKALGYLYKLEDHEAVAQAQERLKRG